MILIGFVGFLLFIAGLSDLNPLALLLGIALLAFASGV